MSEAWRPVPRFEGRYEVSNLGRIRSVPRQVVNKRVTVVPGRMLRPYKHRHHWKVTLYGDNKREEQRFVHQVVAEAFLGPLPPGQLVRHLNDNVDDNRLSNLAYGTHSDNSRDAVRNGIHPETKRRTCDYGHPLDGVSRKGRYCKACNRNKQRKTKALHTLASRQSPGSGVTLPVKQPVVIHKRRSR